MSYEHKLGTAMREGADTVVLPAALDHEVQRKTRSALMIRRRVASGTGRRIAFHWRNVLASVVVVAMLCGFTYGAVKLYDVEFGGVRMQVMSDQALELTQMSGEELRGMVEDVRSQLLPGETAVIYVEPFTREKHHLIRDNPGLGVSNPVVYSDWTAWSSMVEQETNRMRLPATIGEKYTFSSGIRDYALGSGFGLLGKEALDQLREEAARSGARMSWTKVETWDLPTDPLTSFYRAANGEEIYVTIELLQSDVVSMSQYTNNQAYEVAQLGEIEAFYLESLHFLSDTGKVQEVFWMAEDGGRVVNVHIGTQSSDLTKEQLLAIAAEVIQLN